MKGTRLQAGLLFLLTAISINLFSQSQAEEYRLQAEQRKRTETLRVLDSAVALMDHGEYALADKKLLYVLNNIKSIPSDLTFYFGKNSFYLEKYKQSIDWLNKYIQLKGTTGQFSKEATTLLRSAEAGLIKERAKDAEKAEQVLSSGYDIDCGPSGKVTCPVCKGTTVIIRRGYLSDEYRTCGFCDKHGFLTCAEYNQLVRGELQPKQ
ncbi:MAG TPA: hypothetical protein VFU05_17325 [Cyclobacteriaceae bacterium]|nr:hypothetical protein [Cyclobacteriaceae bacterium]